MRRTRGQATASGAARARKAQRRPTLVERQQRSLEALLRRPPREPVALDAQAFVDELNRRLRADPALARGHPLRRRHDGEGASIAPTWEGPESMKPVVARIVKSVIGEFEAERPFLFDR